MADLKLQQLHALLTEYLSIPISDTLSRNEVLKQLHTTYIVKDCKAIRISPQVINEVFSRTTGNHPLREMLTEISCWVMPDDHFERFKAQLPDAFKEGRRFPACDRTTYNKSVSFYTRRVKANEEVAIHSRSTEVNGKVADRNNSTPTSPSPQQPAPTARGVDRAPSPPFPTAFPPVAATSLPTPPLGAAEPIKVVQPIEEPENIARFLPKTDLLLLLHYLKQVSPEQCGQWADRSAVIGMFDEVYQEIANEIIPGPWAPVQEWRKAISAVNEALQWLDEVNRAAEYAAKLEKEHAAIQNEMMRIRNNYREDLARQAQRQHLATMRGYDGANEKSGSDGSGIGNSKGGGDNDDDDDDDDDDIGRDDKYTFTGYGGDNDSLYNVSGDEEEESGLGDKTTVRATGTVLRPAAAISPAAAITPQESQATRQAFGAVQPAASTTTKRTNTFERGQVIRFQDDSSDDESDLIIYEGRR